MNTEKKSRQHPPMPPKRAAVTLSIARHFQSIAIDCRGMGSTNHGLKAMKLLLRQEHAKETARPAGSRQEAKKAAELALAQHYRDTGRHAPVVKRPRHVEKTLLNALERLRPSLPARHTPERIALAQRLYAARSAALHDAVARTVPLANKRGSASACWEFVTPELALLRPARHKRA